MLWNRRGSIAVLATACAALAVGPAALAQAPVAWTTEQDHADMMRQLGIRKLRPAPSGRPDAPNPANYDEAKANPYPDWPELMRLKNGRRVTTARTWWTQRRQSSPCRR